MEEMVVTAIAQEGQDFLFWGFWSLLITTKGFLVEDIEVGVAFAVGAFVGIAVVSGADDVCGTAVAMIDVGGWVFGTCMHL